MLRSTLALQESPDSDVLLQCETSCSRWATDCVNANSILENKNTKKSTRWGVSVYQKWQLDVLKDSTALEDLPRGLLAQRLSLFALQVRMSLKYSQSDSVGERYKRKSYTVIIFALQRWLASVRILKYRECGCYPYAEINIFKDHDFMQFRDNVNHHLAKITQEGKASTDHAKVIPPKDAKLLHEYANSKMSELAELDAKEFSELLYFNVGVNVPMRGRTGHSDLYFNAFTKGVDRDGNEVIVFDPAANQSKAYAGRLNQGEPPEPVNIYPDPAHPALCFHIMYDELSRRRPKDACKKLYLQCQAKKRTKEEFDSGVPVQYSKKLTKGPMGVNKVGELFGSLCQRVGLSVVYKGHCLRATFSTVGHDIGFSFEDLVLGRIRRKSLGKKRKIVTKEQPPRPPSTSKSLSHNICYILV
eukprot:jgi/Botrbrau1/10399/Bobra.0133s0008.1